MKAPFILLPPFVLMLVLATMTVVPGPVHTEEAQGRYLFGRTDYTVNAAFNVRCPSDSVLAICYRFNHINRYLRRINLTITPLEEGDGWNCYKYVYTYIVYSCSLTLRRDIKPDSGLLRFHLQDVRSSMALLPTVLNTGGYYRVDPVAGTDSVRLTYQQKTRMTKPLNIIYTTAIQMETNGFLRRLHRYIQQRSDPDTAGNEGL